ncbi:MAG TPA: hydrogenase expression/formation protein [Acidocella sp.]|nr:hydrogenase expression/formation protein [Acidocella sp.]
MSATPEEGPAYLPLPNSVTQYTPPLLPDDAELREAGDVWLDRIEQALAAYRPGAPQVLDLREASPAALRFLKEVLGSGEVSALAMGSPDVQVEETIFTGLWRVRGDGVDYLEVGDVPRILRERAAAGPMALPDPESISEGVINAPHILAEILARSAKFMDTGETHNFNLDLVPMSDADLGWLVRTLGEGNVVIISAGYGACRIRSTHLAAAWWVQFSNASNQLILNALDIAEIPAVACAAPDDIADSARRVRALRGVYQ